MYVQTGHVVRVMLLLSPAEPPESHVETLGLISRLVRDDQLLKEVLAAKTPMDIMSVIPQREKRIKAANT